MMTNSLTSCVVLALAMVAPALAQERFDSADAAAQALIDAAAGHDNTRLAAIFGPQGNAILTSGNPSQDQAEQSQFSQLARAKHELKADPRNSGRMILTIGDEDWPFPVPLVRTDGKWSFDPSQAKVEMEARRIGAHELDAIEICAGYVEAQRKYAAEDRDKDGMLEYAAHIMSSPNKHDGLYWEGPDALVPRAFAEAVWDGQKRSTKPYHGYYFRILSAQGSNVPGGAHNYMVKSRLIGGFGLVAWPAQYGVTGIHTFMVNQDGVIYQKDVAPPAGGPTVPMTRFDPDSSWSMVD
jgi:hypothetical protein